MIECGREEEHAYVVAQAKNNLPTEQTISSLAEVFKTISEPSRLKILFALRQGEMCVGHLCEAVSGTQSAVSHQLRILRDRNIIKARRDGQNMVYSIADAHVLAVLSLASEHLNCHF